MKRAVVVGLLALLSACDRPEVTDCEQQLKASLKAPSTYKRVNVETVSQFVTIDYDADNSYGAPIRDQAMCTYNLVDGKPNPAQRIYTQNNAKTLVDRLNQP